MWEIRNKTPFAAAGAFERDTEGREVWSVAIRASFTLETAATLTPLDPQIEVRLAPDYIDPDTGELRGEHDIVGFLPGTDLLISGTIQPPRQETMSLPLTLTLGKLSKHARLFGPRMAKRGLAGWNISANAPVETTELTWRNSFGGTFHDPETGHPANPIGKGWALHYRRKIERDTQVELPRIDHPKDDILYDYNRTNPIGFGPISRHWQPRKDLAGTYDDKWEKTRAPKLPKDFDNAFYNTAPSDQIIKGFAKGGEELTLTGFLPDEILKLRLPQILFTARTKQRGQPVDTNFNMTRIEIDLDAKTLSMVWVTHVPCNGDDAGIEYTTLRVKQMSGITV